MEDHTEDVNALVPVVAKTPEHIEQQMVQTRESLTEKVNALENQVVGSVKTAADTLTGTVDAVKTLMDTAPAAVGDSMKQAASAMGDKVKEVFDIRGHLQGHPWTSVSVSAGLGFIAGLLLFRARSEAIPAAPVATAYTPPAAAAAPVSAPTGPGLVDDLLAMVGRKVKELAETAIDSASTAANQTVRDTVPKLLESEPETPGSLQFNGVAHR
ncbi:MAG: hypothetical protein C0467_16515 [Planctomycetaceae bacterium]|nr:hypothetical protein [Planctomycetaceae bacterium]